MDDYQKPGLLYASTNGDVSVAPLREGALEKTLGAYQPDPKLRLYDRYDLLDLEMLGQGPF